jgi:hypothetical protein
LARSKETQKKNFPPGSPRTFSTVSYPRTCSLRAKRRPPLSLSFFHSAYFVCFVPKRVGGKSQVEGYHILPAFLPWRKGTDLVGGFMDGFRRSFATSGPPHTFSSKLSSPPSVFSRFAPLPLGRGRLGRGRKKSQRSLRSFFQCNTGNLFFLSSLPLPEAFLYFTPFQSCFFPCGKVHTIPPARRRGKGIRPRMAYWYRSLPLGFACPF